VGADRLAGTTDSLVEDFAHAAEPHDVPPFYRHGGLTPTDGIEHPVPGTIDRATSSALGWPSECGLTVVVADGAGGTAFISGRKTTGAMPTR